MKKYELFYHSEAPYGCENEYIFDHNAWENKPDDGWEKWSLPIGNGYMGVNVFGRTETERLQITENSLANPATYMSEFKELYARRRGIIAGLSNFCELYLDIGHPSDKVTDYKRSLDLNTGLAKVSYAYQGVTYSREHFTSYPDRVFVTRLVSDTAGAINVKARVMLPGIGDHLIEEGDGFGRSGEISVENGVLRFTGEMNYYSVKYEGQIALINEGGTKDFGKDFISITGADAVTVIVSVGTNYRLESRVFLETDPKKKLAPYPHPRKDVETRLKRAAATKYTELLARHLADFCPIMARASVDLGGVDPNKPTDVLLKEYGSSKESVYLEELYFKYGRYLLVSSSRPGTYPANLQGTWNKYTASPWSSGYWHNINVQMNYWPAFNTNLLDCFLPYLDYYYAYKPLTERKADMYVKTYFPEKYSSGEGENGFLIGTGCWLYDMGDVGGPGRGHSGPGTGAFTTKLFADYFDFSQDKARLMTVYKANRSMARYLSKMLEEQEDGKLLVKYSASPEQRVDPKDPSKGFYHTKGCAFDQQMVWECYTDTVKYADMLGECDEFIEQIRKDVNRLDPVQIGLSGQIKEYREEQYYGDIGEYHHRHISHLVGLYPGTVINGNTPDWLKAAEYSLNERGDISTGWSTGHKMNAWARIKNGNRAHDLLHSLLANRTLPNLWDTHPPFQIDGNLGATAGIAEMLIQSHEGCVHVLPALPDCWNNGSFDGLTARGGITVSATWKDKRLTSVVAKATDDCTATFLINGNRVTRNLPKGKKVIVK